MVVIMKGISLLFILSFVLIGCSGLSERVDGRLVDAAVSVRAINDAKLSHSQDLYCDGQSTGAVAREYGPHEEMWGRYWELCNTFRSLTGSITIPPAINDQIIE